MKQASVKQIDTQKIDTQKQPGKNQGQLVETEGGFTWRVPERYYQAGRLATILEVDGDSDSETEALLQENRRRGPFQEFTHKGAFQEFTQPNEYADDVRFVGEGGRTLRKKTLARILRFTSRSNAFSSNWRESLKNGTVIGLLLGCISMVLFHQVAEPASSEQSLPTSPAAVTAFEGFSTVPQFHISLPSAKVFVLEVGPYTSESRANTVQQSLQKSGTSAQVVPTNTGYTVWARSALTNAGTSVAGLDKSFHPSVATIEWPAESVPTSLVTSKEAATAASKWLASMMSALRVETGVVPLETALRDATQAARNAELSLPPNSTWTAGSPPPFLSKLSTHIETAATLLQKKQNTKAEQEILQAWSDLIALRTEWSTNRG